MTFRRTCHTTRLKSLGLYDIDPIPAATQSEASGIANLGILSSHDKRRQMESSVKNIGFPTLVSRTQTMRTVSISSLRDDMERVKALRQNGDGKEEVSAMKMKSKSDDKLAKPRLFLMPSLFKKHQVHSSANLSS